MAAQSSHLPILIAPSPLSAGLGLYTQDEMIDLNRMVCNGQIGSHMAYEVSGSSCEPYIAPGSIVVVNRNRTPVNRDIVAVLLNDAAFVKVFERKTGLRLVSPNKEYPDQEVRETDDFHVLGVVEWTCSPVRKAISTRVGTLLKLCVISLTLRLALYAEPFFSAPWV
jgi:SOS-response transcriptional repressor LexA